MIILAIEHTGRLSTDARLMIKGIADRASRLTGFTKDYARTVTALYQQLAVAVQKGNALMFASCLSACAQLRNA